MSSTSRPSVRQRLTGNRGFTLVEMVITVAVLAILVSISMPSIFEFMRQRDRQAEEIAQEEIRKAMQAYLADKGVLPADSATGTAAWYNQLAAYTNLSADQIQNDVWKRGRVYILYPSSTRKLFGTNVDVYYATIHSMGLNGEAEDSYTNSSGTKVTIPGLSVANKLFRAASDTNWWKGSSFATDTAKIDAFSALRPGGDDIMLRFTNYSEMLDRYNTTVQRLDRVTQALESFARSRYAERVSACNVPSPNAALCANGIPEQTVYYPRARPTSGGSDDATYQDSTIIVDNTKADTARRTDMVALMNKLGLPAEFCCSALTNASDGEPLPFYYFSNPRPRASGSGCEARPAATSSKLPARITTKNDGNTCG